MKRLILAIAALCLVPLSAVHGGTVEGVTKIENVKELVSLHTEGVRFVDVRSARSYNLGHIPGAANLTIDTPDFNEDALMALVGKDEKVLFYCNCTAGCDLSPRASELAASWGFRNVFFSKGGAIDWRYKAGLELESSD